MHSFFLVFSFFFFFFFFLLILESGGERETETLIYCSTYLCIHWLIVVCALNGDQTLNLGISEQRSNQLSYAARAWILPFLKFKVYFMVRFLHVLLLDCSFSYNKDIILILERLKFLPDSLSMICVLQSSSI